MTQLFKALKFAAEKHRRQRRKDADATPYINHPIAVAELLARAGGVTDPAMLQAAVLHDTVEDTDATPQELEELFGPDVRALVAELTDDKSLPKAERKRLQIEHAPHMTPRAQAIKLADKTCNIGDLSPNDPADWPLARKLEYFAWAERVVAGLRGCNPALEAEFDRMVATRREAMQAAA